MRVDSLLKDVLCVHPPVVLGQFDGEDDTGNEKDGAASQTKPEGVLENRSKDKDFHFQVNQEDNLPDSFTHLCVCELNVSKV